MPITVGYWGIKGLGELVRLTALVAGAEFTEYNPAGPEAWAEKKATLNTSFPNLPFLEHDGFVLTESGAIPWYLARTNKPDLAGNNIQEETQILQIQGVLSDLKAEVFKAAFSPEYKTSLGTAAAAGKIPNKIAALSKQLGENVYLVGNHVTIADIFLAYHLYFIKNIYASADLESPLAAYPNLLAAEANFWALPQVAPHVASDAFKRPFLPPTMAPWLKF